MRDRDMRERGVTAPLNSRTGGKSPPYCIRPPAARRPKGGRQPLQGGERARRGESGEWCGGDGLKKKKLEMVVELLVLEMEEREEVGGGDGQSGRRPWGCARAGWRRRGWRVRERG